MKILFLYGPNLNLLGTREPEVYGDTTYEQLLNYIDSLCAERDIEAKHLQSNHEGALIDAIHAARGHMDGLIINAGAYSHTSIALLDAIKAVEIPAIEVHLTDIYQREPFRHTSYVGMACRESICGQGIDGYRLAIDSLLRIAK